LYYLLRETVFQDGKINREHLYIDGNVESCVFSLSYLQNIREVHIEEEDLNTILRSPFFRRPRMDRWLCLRSGADRIEDFLAPCATRTALE